MNDKDKHSPPEDDVQPSLALLETGSANNAAVSSRTIHENSPVPRVYQSTETEGFSDGPDRQGCSSQIEKNRRSSVWKHFSIVEEGGVRFAACNICTKKLRQSRAAGTGTLRNHIAGHDKVASAVRAKKQATMDLFQTNAGPSGAQYARLSLPSPEQRRKLIKWMVTRNVPFAEVEDLSFREFVFSMNPNVKMMSRTCARADILKLYDEMKLMFMRRVASIPGGICVSVDGWTSECQRKNYIAIVITFLEKWKRKSVLLSLKGSECESHTGEVIANLIYSELKLFDLHTKLFAMASDNGSNMIAAWPVLVELCAKDGTILDEDMHARCACHVINIVVRSFLKNIGANKSLNVSELSDPDAYDPQNLHARSVNLVRFITSFVHSSPKRLSKFKSSQRMSRISDELVLLPVSETITRWNSTYSMLKRALDIRGALSVVLVGEVDDTSLFPTEDTWAHVETVVSFLEPFFKTTEELQGDVPLTNAVPSYNELFDHLEDWAASLRSKLRGVSSKERDIWASSIDQATNLLSKYYSKTDSRLYSCVTFCDPRMREYYWTDAGYETEWIEKAQAQVREVYSSRYALYSRAVSRNVLPPDEVCDSVCRAMKKRACEASDELVLYQQGRAAVTNNPFEWWRMHAAEYPGLARMSLDMLAVPASTASVERVFSQAKLILTDGRSVLDAELAGKIASLGSWFRELEIGK